MIRLLLHVLYRNWLLKVVALVLALVVWLILVPQDKVLSRKTIPASLELENIPSGMEIVQKPPSTIEITVRAPKRLLAQITPATVAVRLSLGRATTYQQEYPLNQDMVTLPPGAEVLDMTPNKVTVRLEKTREAVLDVHATIRGKVASGFRIARVEVDPSQVVVHGPEGRLKPKDTVTTAPIDVTDLRQTTVFDVDIILPQPDLRLVATRTKVRVTVFVEEEEGGAKAAAPKKK